jgi:TetR/AcrR family transcriptional repressor of nem operon
VSRAAGDSEEPLDTWILDDIYNLKVRYPAGHKDRIREKIVAAASRRFRGRGGEGVPIADLMRELKLTHGGFYRHFTGKEQLFNEAFMASMAQARASMMRAAGAAPPGRELEAIIATYLSPGHCASPSQGCPLAALSTEIARHPKSTRAEFDRMLRAHAAEFARFMPGATAEERERQVMVLFAGMAGALNAARAASDDDLRRAILEQARTFYLDALRH